ncbi:peroxiredoxin [Friedmanniella endophytica]|uniref:Peroxiredoxin n=1 Tax=Microlunatus kandeliicorticis TaxID=1759536 RepID=A0A7W3P7A1_9ACTN|nr:redoxin domain-containing protein [Microlunatus kandeliicorticis]MBA8795762.1 peroxiredoxin [Microlunatus kandeliicorticis]
MVADRLAADAVRDFSLPDTHGVERRLSALRGRPVALVFFPFAFTAVCTGELRELSAGYPAVREAGAEVLAISTDTRYALRVFAETEGFVFPLLSDFWPHGAVAQRFHAFDAGRGCATRATVLLDAEQRIVSVDRARISATRDITAELARLAGRSGV